MSRVLEDSSAGRTTLVMYSDLLGFGSMISNANGSLDSAVGKIAKRRIELLRSSLLEVEKQFPNGTKFFHLNDLVLASFDVSIKIDSMPVDAESIHSKLITREAVIDFLKFVSASASLHQSIISKENEVNIGPAGRTFVVLGKRWDVAAANPESLITHIPELQGNMALAEAYQADSLGSSEGFAGNPWDRFYLNDYAWFTAISGTVTAVPGVGQITSEEADRLRNLGNKGKNFPFNLIRQPELNVTIFHRKRKFQPIMSHHACDIANCLSL